MPAGRAGRSKRAGTPGEHRTLTGASSGFALGVDRAGQQEPDRGDPVAVALRQGHRPGPGGRQAQCPCRPGAARFPRRAGGGIPGEHGAHLCRSESPVGAAGQAQHRVQGRAAGDRHGLGVGGRPRPRHVRAGVDEMGEERGGRPGPAGGFIGHQQVRRVLGRDLQPRRSGAGAEEVGGGARVRPPRQPQRLGRARVCP